MVIKQIDMLSPEAEVYRGLTERQLTAENGLFIAESVNVIAAAVEAGYTPLSFLSEKRHIPALESAFGERFPLVPLYTSESSEIEKLAGYRLHRGVLAAFRRKPVITCEEAVKGAKRIAVLENVTDAANVGAVFRSAAALGMDAVLLTGSACDPLHRRALRVSMGAVFRIPWAILPPSASDPAVFVKSLGFTAAALALDESAVPPDDPSLKSEDRLALFIGAEGPGLRPATVASCDRTVCIPMRRGMDSLNAAAAAAVAFWELGRA